MLKKLKRQFLLDAMVIAVIVILGGILSLISITYTYQRNQSLQAMNEVLDNVTDLSVNVVSNKYYGGTGSQQQTAYDGVIFTIITDANGNILSAGCNQSDVSVDGEMLTNSTKYAIEAKKDSGNVKGYSLRFLRRDFKGGYKIALADRSQEQSNLYFQIRMYLFGSLVLLVIAFIIIWFMSDRAIAPVSKSIQDQKRFIADASHELKTPVTVILANTDILESDPSKTIGERKKWIDSTKSEANRMTNLVNEMLYLARADAGITPQLNFQKVNLSDIVDDCVLTCESLAYENHVHLQAKIANNVFIVGDEGKLKQIIMVLIENAMKYVDKGGSIMVSLHAFPVQRAVKVSVVNSGTPIPAEKIPHLFDRFYRADEARTREKGGYGLGLSIAQNMVQLHHGTIGVDYSDAQRGTCFSVRFPLEGSPRAPKITPPQAMQPEDKH